MANNKANNKVIIVDALDNEIGLEEKIRAHKLGLLHRAFSVFVFNSKNELLLQKRSLSKYHSPGLWSNTCCSHPVFRGNIKEQAEKRLMHEMGISSNLKEKFSFVYRAELGNGLIEHEFDHVFFGFSDKDPSPNKDEVMAWKWVSLKSLNKDIKLNPGKYTVWIKICLGKINELIPLR